MLGLELNHVSKRGPWCLFSIKLETKSFVIEIKTLSWFKWMPGYRNINLIWLLSGLFSSTWEMHLTHRLPFPTYCHLMLPVMDSWILYWEGELSWVFFRIRREALHSPTILSMITKQTKSSSVCLKGLQGISTEVLICPSDLFRSTWKRHLTYRMPFPADGLSWVFFLVTWETLHSHTKLVNEISHQLDQNYTWLSDSE